MSNFLDEVLEKAKKLSKTIVLPEGEDARVVKAASDAQVRGIAKIVLLGDEAEIRKNNPDENLDGVTIINPKTSPKRAEYAKLLYELRKNKGMTEEDAEGNVSVSSIVPRARFRRVPFHGQYAAPRFADRKDHARRAAGFQLFSDDPAQNGQSLRQGRRAGGCRLRH